MTSTLSGKGQANWTQQSPFPHHSHPEFIKYLLVFEDFYQVVSADVIIVVTYNIWVGKNIPNILVTNMFYLI